MCILDLSKVLMCEFRYDYIKNNYSNNFRVLFTDTDSLMYEIKTEDVFKGFSNDKRSKVKLCSGKQYDRKYWHR